MSIISAPRFGAGDNCILDGFLVVFAWKRLSRRSATAALYASATVPFRKGSIKL